MDQLQQMKDLQSELHINKEEINTSVQINREKVQENSEQINRNDSLLNESFQEVSEEKNSIRKLNDDVPEEPNYIGMEKKFTKNFGDGEDSPKMKAVREALDKYHEPGKYGLTDKQAIEELIKACDKYCSGRFEIFKRGRGLKRLQEVKALREKARTKLEYYEAHSEDYIVTDRKDAYIEVENEMASGASLGKKIVAGVATFFGFTVLNLAKIVALQPLWGKEAFQWRIGTYYYGAIRAQDRLFGRVKYVDGTKEEDGKIVADSENLVKKRVTYTSTSLKDKEKSKTYAKENKMMQENIERYIHSEGEDHPAELDDGYEDYESLKELKSNLIDEFKKEKPDFKKIKKLEGQISELEAAVQKFAKDVKELYPNLDFNMDESEKMEKEIYHLRIQKAKINERKVDASSELMLKNLYANDAYGSSITTTELIKKKWIENGDIPENEVDRLIKKAFDEWSFEGEVQSEAEKQRIKEKFKERFAQSIRAAKTYQQMHYRVTDDTPSMPDDYEHRLKEQSSGLQRDIHNLLIIDKTRTKEEKEEFLKEFTNAWTYKDTSDMTEEEKAQYEKEQKEGQIKQANMLKPFIEVALSMTDFEKFNVSNDDELIEKYYMLREELTYGFVLSATLDEYVNLGGELTDEQYQTIKAVAMTLQSVKAYYDGRMTMMKSPYYFLTDDEKLADMKEKDIDDRVEQIEDVYDNTAYKRYLDAWTTQRKESQQDVTSWGVAIFHGNDVENTFKLSKEAEKKKGRKKEK